MNEITIFFPYCSGIFSQSFDDFLFPRHVFHRQKQAVQFVVIYKFTVDHKILKPDIIGYKKIK